MKHIVHGVHQGTLFARRRWHKTVWECTIGEFRFTAGKRYMMTIYIGPQDSAPPPVDLSLHLHGDIDRLFITEHGDIFHYDSDQDVWYWALSPLERVLL